MQWQSRKDQRAIRAIEYFNKRATLQPIDIIASLYLPSIDIYSTMALVDVRYITWDEYVDKRNNQDHLLREEFGKVHNRMDTFGTEIQVLKEDVVVLKEDVIVLKDDSTENKVNFLQMQR